MGEQFSKLKIADALQVNKGDVDEAIEYLLKEQCNISTNYIIYLRKTARVAFY